MSQEDRQPVSPWSQSLVDVVPDPLVVASAVRDESGAIVDLEYVAVNQAALQDFPNVDGPLVGRLMSELFPAVRESLLEQYAKVLETSTPLVLADHPMYHPLLGTRYYDIHAVRTDDYLCLAYRDTTRRRLALDAAVRAAGAESAARQRLRGLLDSMIDSYFAFEAVRDGDGRIADFRCTEANRAAAVGMRRPRSDVVGSLITTLLPGEDRDALVGAFAAVVESGQPLEMEDRGYRLSSDDPLEFFDYLAVPFGDGVALSVRNVSDRHRSEHAVSEARDRLRATLDSIQDPVVLLTAVRRDGHVVDFEHAEVNPAACRAIDRPASEVLGSLLSHVMPTLFATGLVDRYIEVVETGQPLLLDEFPYEPTPEAGPRYLDLSAVKVGDGLTLTWRDVTERHDSVRRLAMSENRYRILAENAMDLVYVVDQRSTLTWVSPSVVSLLGFEPSELVGRSSFEVADPRDRDTMAQAIARAAEGERLAYRVRFRTASGNTRWVEVTPRVVRDSVTNEPVGRIVGVRDVDDEMAARAQLEREQLFDALTGLAKRQLAVERVQAVLDSRGQRWWALLCVGVNGLRAVNHGFGYAAGDEVIRTVAGRLVAAAGLEERVARIAGDEFAVVLGGIDSASDAADAAVDLLAAVRGPVHVDHSAVAISASIGICPVSERSAAELIRDASAAMRQARRRGPDTWGFLRGDASEDARQGLRLKAALGSAVDEGLIHPWLMPIVSLVDERIVGYEALARWGSRDGSPTPPPSEFLPIAEGSDLIRLIDWGMIEQVLSQIHRLPADQHVALNVSALTLADAGFEDDLLARLRGSGRDPASLHLEVTETVLFDVTAGVIEQMRRLAELGIRWWVDDFGTGYSSISHLRDLPIHGLKLDRSFTAGLRAENIRTTSLARGLAGLAEGLGLSTVAEGVETASEARLLIGQGWQLGQGWLYGQPRPLDDVLAASA